MIILFKKEYGKKSSPIFPFHVIPTKYDQILNHIDGGINDGLFSEERYAFVTGHTETYKVGVHTKERLKVLGKLATKMQLEGKMETVLYSRVEMEGSEPKYILESQNNGFNTARSPMGLFEGKIDNDYKLIFNKLKEY